MEQIDIVLQGGFTEYVNETTDYYLQLPFVNKVVISCWSVDNINYRHLDNPKVEYCVSEIPKNRGTGNRNYQIVSSLNGLKKCGSLFSIKFRNDQRYHHESMFKMYEYFLQHKDREISYWDDVNKPKGKIFVGGNFTVFPFHPRDHFFGDTPKI